MIKQVVVRCDEQIIAELDRRRRQHDAVPKIRGRPRSSSRRCRSAVGKTNRIPAYSLKGRVGKKIASEEKRLIAEVLTKTNWNRRKAAELLEISYRSLLYKIKDYDLEFGQVIDASRPIHQPTSCKPAHSMGRFSFLEPSQRSE